MSKRFRGDASDGEHSDASDASEEKVKFKVLSNKSTASMVPKPSMVKKTATQRPFDFRMTFINSILLYKFLLPASRAVQKMRFVLCCPKNKKDFQGFKIECHDPSYTLADRGLFECDVESGRPDHEIDGTTFCVSATAFMQCLGSSTQRETDLCITRFLTKEGHEEDQITFESVNNEMDVRARYACGLLDFSHVDTLDGISIDLGFHATVQLGVLKELSLNAKNCKAQTLKFGLWQATDSKDPTVMHSKMSVGFQGDEGNASGSHEFCISMKKSAADATEKWTPVSNDDYHFDESKMHLRSANEYDNKKLRKFLNHMECHYVLVHLCTDNTPQPLVLDCVLGGPRTKHTVIVVPRCEAS